MAKKNKGWDYLNSDDINSMSDGSKDDWGYIDSGGCQRRSCPTSDCVIMILIKNSKV